MFVSVPPVVLFKSALEPTAVLPLAVLNKRAAVPMAVFSSAVFSASAPAPTPVLKLAVVPLKSEYQPIPVLAEPVVRLCSAFCP